MSHNTTQKLHKTDNILKSKATFYDCITSKEKALNLLIMKRAFIIVFVFLLDITIFTNCKKENGEPKKIEDKYSLESYKDSENPFDNLNYCFAKAKGILGDSARFYLITGVQKDSLPNQNFNINLKWFFIKDHKSLEFDISKKIINEIDITVMFVGYEFISEDDSRLKQLQQPKLTWANCIAKYKKPLLNFKLFVPLIYPPANPTYYFFTKSGQCDLGIDFFVYDASTGDDITNK